MGTHVTRTATRATRQLTGVLLAVAMLLTALVVPAGAVQTTLPNSEQPLPNTARVMDGYVYDIDRVGDLVVVAGEFSTVRDYAFDSPDQTRNFIFAYDQSTGEVSQTFVPVVDDIVHAVHITDGGDQVLVAGRFRTVNGASQRGIARLNLDDGSLDPTWTGQTSSGVLAMAVTDDEVVVGGWFDWAGGLNRPRVAALDPETGQGIAAFEFSLSGRANPADGPSQIQQVVELDASPDQKYLALVGNQTEIDGQPRGQLGLIDLDDYSLVDWSVPEYGRWPCSTVANKVTYLTDVAFSPDGTYLIGGSLGAYRNGPGNGLCDTTARFELPPYETGPQEATWISYTGGDSIYQVTVTDAAVYIGGHQRWLNNPFPTNTSGNFQADRDGPGAVLRPGLSALDPLTGVPFSWYPNRDGARPIRGYQAMVTEGDLLHLGSDGTVVGGEVRQRVQAYSVAGGPVPPVPEAKTLPATLMALGDDGVLDASGFDGTTMSAETAVAGPGVDGSDWSGVGDGFLQNGELTYFGTDDAYYRRPFEVGAVGSDTNLSTTVGYVDTETITPYDQPYNVDTTVAAAYVDGRIVYTKQGSTDLHWRWYGLESGIIGTWEHVLDSSQDWSGASAMAVIGDRLYAAWSDDVLYSYGLTSLVNAISVDAADEVVVEDTRSWSTVRALFSVAGDDSSAPETMIDSPASDGEVVDSDSVVSGTVIDDREAAGVEVTIGSADGTSWVQPDGSVGGTEQVLTPTLTGTAPTEQFWSIDVSLPDGDWVATATGRDAAGNVDPSPATRSFTVSSALPTSTITSPAQGAEVELGTITVTGEATDLADGIATVGVTLRNRDTLDWLQPDGTFASSFARVDATLDDPGGATTGWSLDVDLDVEARWAVTSRAVAPDGTTQNGSTWQSFTTIQPVPDDAVEPDSAVTDPAAGADIGVGDVTLTGTATDDVSGVADMDVAVRRIADGTWLRADGSFGSFQWLDTTLASPGSTSTTWTTTVTLADSGDYAIVPRAVDVAGNVEQNRAYHVFQAVTAPGDDVEPDSSVVSPATREVVPTGTVTIAGQATDDSSGVARVELTVRNRRTLEWLQPDGTWAAGYSTVDAVVADPGATDTTWSLDVNVGADDYAVTSRATDGGGNTQSSPDWSPFTAQ